MGSKLKRLKICAALNVECDENLEFTKRIREKKTFLMEKTNDESIIDNAITTALNQDYLANLLYMDYKTIYLCGENFTVPIRVENKKYIAFCQRRKLKFAPIPMKNLPLKISSLKIANWRGKKKLLLKN